MSTSRAPTMEDVAEAAGVSRALVSLVMRDSPKVSAHRREAVLDAARTLGYRPNAAARHLAARRTATIGVVINDLHNTYFADVVDGLHDVASRAGYRLLLSTGWRDEADERDAIESFIEHRLDAIVVLSPGIHHDELRVLAGLAPMVVVAIEVEGIDAVLNDDYHGGQLAARHLIDLGHTEIVHVDGGNGGGADLRRRGFVETISAAGLEPRVEGGDFSETGGVAAIDRIVTSGRLPTAIFLANDLSAVGALDRLDQLGYRVPEDVSIMGYDNTAISALRPIDLTTIHQPKFEMGQAAMRCVLERLDGTKREPTILKVVPELEVRGTTARLDREGGHQTEATSARG